jgi:VIT1/CCC1 family predicted Fe2+/Mn2+ transporter
MGNRHDLARFRANLQAERDGAGLYRTLAELETQPQLAEVYRRMADSEDRHAKFWEQKIAEAGGTAPRVRLSVRARTLVWLARRFGVRFVLPTIAGQETSNAATYDGQADARGQNMQADEQSHVRLLAAMGAAGPAGMEGSAVARLEGRHRAVGGNALRAAVLGANDGLVSNMSLVMGVAGAEAGANLGDHAVLITGLAGLLAGACSMAMGEWLSVQSSRELYQRQIAIEKDELAASPEEEAEELALIYQSKGLPEPQARDMAVAIIQDKSTALDTLAREELGIDPKELGGSALEAAVTSFALFAVGAIVPVIPFMFLGGGTAVMVSLAASTVVLFGIGAAITLLTGRGILYTGMRQLLFGYGAAGVTYGIGRLIGASLGG